MAKKRNIPHTYVIVFYIIAIVAVMTWFVPGGEFGREVVTLENGSTKEVIKDNSFQYTESEP
ncbi:MAG: YfcC family protein, partial [Bacteroidales bacterium]|nr:YfcC family protein [Bacteroidales bacterium]